MLNSTRSGYPRKINAGTVNTSAAATDSPADPTVCVMLCSRIARCPCRGRNSAIAMTAIGTDADTVNPTRSAR